MKPSAALLAEQCTLGSVLLAPSCVGTVLEAVKDEDFFDLNHRMIFRAMAALARENKPIDCVAIMTLLRADGLDGEKTFGQLMSLTAVVASAANVEHHAARVRANARLRRIASTARAIAEGAETATDADEYIAQSQSRLLEMTQDIKGEIVPAREWVTRAYKRFEERSASEQPPALETGIVGLDRMRLFRRGSLVTIAARPGAGKSSLAQNIALGAAQNGFRSLFVSIEMGDEELENKFLGAKSGIATRTLEWPKYLAEGDWPRLARATGEISNQCLDLWVASSVHIDTLRLRVRRLHAQRPIDFIFIDYIQLMRGEQGDGRVQEVSSITRGLKVLAKEINACVFGLSQLNRDVEKRKPSIPILADLRESGSIEADSDAVIFIFRPSMYDDEANVHEAQAIVAKHRHGAPGKADLYFDPPIQRFSDLEAPR